MKFISNTRRLIGVGEKKTRYLMQLIMVIMIGLLDVTSASALGVITRNLTKSGEGNLPVSFVYFAAATVLARAAGVVSFRADDTDDGNRREQL